APVRLDADPHIARRGLDDKGLGGDGFRLHLGRGHPVPAQIGLQSERRPHPDQPKETNRTQQPKKKEREQGRSEPPVHPFHLRGPALCCHHTPWMGPRPVFEAERRPEPRADSRPVDGLQWPQSIPKEGGAMTRGTVKTLEAGGFRWSYREAEGQGTPVLFLHAFPLQKAMWDPVVDRLAGRAALAVDLPGFGGSRPVPERPSMDGYAAAIAAFLDALNVDRVVLCGLSMGGYLAFAFWRQHRERVAGLILADTRAGADTPEAREGRFNLIARLKEEGSRAATGSLPNLVGPTTREAQPGLLA